MFAHTHLNKGHESKPLRLCFRVFQNHFSSTEPGLSPLAPGVLHGRFAPPASQHIDCASRASLCADGTAQAHGGFGVRHFERRFLGQYPPGTDQGRLADAVLALLWVASMVIYCHRPFRHDFPSEWPVPRLWLTLLPIHPIPA